MSNSLTHPFENAKSTADTPNERPVDIEKNLTRHVDITKLGRYHGLQLLVPGGYCHSLTVQITGKQGFLALKPDLKAICNRLSFMLL